MTNNYFPSDDESQGKMSYHLLSIKLSKDKDIENMW
jgi:hypothetical protein